MTQEQHAEKNALCVCVCVCMYNTRDITSTMKLCKRLGEERMTQQSEHKIVRQNKGLFQILIHMCYGAAECDFYSLKVAQVGALVQLRRNGFGSIISKFVVAKAVWKKQKSEQRLTQTKQGIWRLFSK